VAVRPPKLTRQEFLRKKPVNPVAGRSGGQRYQAYLTAYQNKYKPVRQQAPQNPVPTLQSLLAQVGRFETPAQLEARANRMANQGVKAQQAIIREEAAAMRKEAQLRAESMAAAGRAAAAQNAGLFGMVGGEYNAGAQEIRGLGTNLANQMQATTEGDLLAQNAGLAAVGAPAIAVGGPAGANTVAGAPQAGVEAYRGGELPGQMIGTQGQAATFGLAGMVSAQNLRATQEAQAGLMEATRQADAARLSALKELAAGRPSQAAQFLQQLQEAQRQQIGLASGLIQQRAGMRQAGFEQGMTKKEYGQKVKQQAFQNKQTVLAMNIDLSQVDPVKSQALGYIVDKAGRPILQNGRRIPAKKLTQALAGTSKTRSMTPGQRVALMQKAQTAMENAYYGYMNVEGKRVPATEAGEFDPENPQGTGRLQYQQAIQRLTSMGVGPEMARQLASQYYRPGEAGRPILTPQQKKLLARKLGSQAEATRIIRSIESQLPSPAAQHRLSELLETLEQ
jgi:hypothetical protein